MKQTFKKMTCLVGGAALLVGMMVTGAQALTITPNDGNLILGTNYWIIDGSPGNDYSDYGDGSPAGNCDADCMSDLTGMPGLTEVYKMDQGQEPNDTGSLAGSYDTTFANTVDDPQDAHITYEGGAFLDCQNLACKALVKDGNGPPLAYAFDLNDLGWNGTDDLWFEDFWPGTGAISHVSLFSGEMDDMDDMDDMNDMDDMTDAIPEPATVLLFGSGLAGLGLWRLKQKK